MSVHLCVSLHSCIVLCLSVVQWEKQMVRSANFITIQGLTPNKTYYIRVLAFTSVGDGPLSQDLQIIAKTGGKTQQVKEGCQLLTTKWLVQKSKKGNILPCFY